MTYVEFNDQGQPVATTVTGSTTAHRFATHGAQNIRDQRWLENG